MRYYVIAIPLVAALALGSYFANPTNSVTVIQKKHTKLFYDRIEPDPNATMILYMAGDLSIEKGKPKPPEPCLMKSRKRSKVDGRCYLEARLPENQ